MNIRDLRITKVELTHLRLPQKYVLKVATGTYTYFEPILIRMHTNAGIVGISEVECFSGYDRIGVEPAQGVIQILEEALVPQFIGENPFDVELIYRKMDRIVQGHVWVKAGMDIALYDVMGKALNVPAYYLLGGRVRWEHPVEGVGYGIPMDEPDRVAEIAKKATQTRWGKNG